MVVFVSQPRQLTNPPILTNAPSPSPILGHLSPSDMFTIYLIALLVGGFFVTLSLFGGDGDSDAALDAHADFDAHADLGGHADVAGDHGPGAGAGFVDLLSLRTLFLFSAFFGLTGTVFTWQDAGEPYTALLAVLVGLVAGLGGSLLIKRVAQKQVSSTVTTDDLRGKTARVRLPFEPGEHGTVDVVVKGSRLRVLARPFDDSEGAFAPGDEVVIVEMQGREARVVRPGGALPAPGTA